MRQRFRGRPVGFSRARPLSSADPICFDNSTVFETSRPGRGQQTANYVHIDVKMDHLYPAKEHDSRISGHGRRRGGGGNVPRFEFWGDVPQKLRLLKKNVLSTYIVIFIDFPIILK